MSKPLEKGRAIALRKVGLSYSEILAKVPVAKSTLSGWFRVIGLSERQRQRLAARKLVGAHRGAQKLHEQKLLRVASTLFEAGREAQHLLKARELLWVIGTVLYWAEGAKVKEWRTNARFMFTNTDPLMILLVRDWLLRYCSVSAFDITYALYIHQNANIPAARKFWARSLSIDQSELLTYFKRHNPAPRRKQIGRTYYGIMRMSARRSTVLSHRIAGWIQAVVKYCGVG